MSAFGVTEIEEETYRRFLRHPDTPATDLHLLLDTDQHKAEQILDRLQELGLLRLSGRQVVPTDPEVALARLADMRLHELHQVMQQVMHSRHVVDELRAEQRARASAPRGVEQLNDLSTIRERIDDLAFFAREEILSVEPYTHLLPENIEHARPLDLRCLRRGVRIRNVVLRKALDDPPTAGYLRELAAEGAGIRVADDIGERILVYDRTTALVPVDPRDTSRGALMAHEGGLVANVVALFEKIWDQAEDLVVGDGDRPEDERRTLDETGRRVLASMCSGDKDEIGARELNVSVRTYRRYVAELMRALGASSRAQAALLARERGWI